MGSGALRPFACVVVACLASFAAADAHASTAPSVVEISPPPPSFGTDAAALRSAADGEIRKMDAVLIRDHRSVVVSLALAPAAVDSVVCNVNATVRDARTGVVLAIIDTAARAGGPISKEQRKELAYSAVRNAVRRVTPALVRKK
jgi:hypothetical protein